MRTYSVWYDPHITLLHFLHAFNPQVRILSCPLITRHHLQERIEHGKPVKRYIYNTCVEIEVSRVVYTSGVNRYADSKY